jgi:hypothetical protein
MTDGPISYCADVHPAEDLAGLLAGLERYSARIRQTVPLDRLGVGLRLAPLVASALASDRSARRRLRAELVARGLEVVTLDAAPLGLDRGVPWSEPARLRYTLDCAAVLADLLPDQAAYGTISTLALGAGATWSRADDDLARAALETLTARLRSIDAVQGRPVTLAFEPQPGCALETVGDAVGWLAGRVDPKYVGLCLDACHLAVSFVDPAVAVAAIYQTGLTVRKLQAGSALHIERPRELPPDALAGLRAAVRERRPDGGTLAAPDLATARADLPGLEPWRVDVHLPLHSKPGLPLRGTRKVLRATVAALLAAAGPSEFPLVETETFGFPPGPAADADTGRPVAGEGLAGAVAADLAWFASVLDDLGLLGAADPTESSEPADSGVPSLGARSQAGPMTRVGGAWVRYA